MTHNIVPQREDKRKLLHELTARVHDVYSEDTRRLVYLCYEKGVTAQEIANSLGTTRSNIAMQYPKKKKEKHVKG